MGKGDKKTKRGKIIKGSYGVRRPKAKTKRLSGQKLVLCLAWFPLY
ncbi:MAG: 30S ribosomal protein THX [Flavobacteriaceae bacterium]|nr:30S ribosomal protein THX [Flavobacteriaceae bacterium]